MHKSIEGPSDEEVTGFVRLREQLKRALAKTVPGLEEKELENVSTDRPQEGDSSSD